MSDNAVDYCFHILMAISVVVFNVLVKSILPEVWIHKFTAPSYKLSTALPAQSYLYL